MYRPLYIALIGGIALSCVLFGSAVLPVVLIVQVELYGGRDQRHGSLVRALPNGPALST